MVDTLDADVFRSASLESALAHLTGPLAAGAQRRSIALRADSTFRVPALRQPAALLVLRRSLELTPLVVEAQLDALGFARFEFPSFSEAGASLLVASPAVSATTEQARAFRVTLRLVSGPSAALGELLELQVVEGILGKLLWLLGSEKTRIRRELAELSAVRRLEVARDDALDRIGEELNVPRFRATLEWDAAQHQPLSRSERESDAAYRARLAIQRPFALPTRRRLELALNGGAAQPSLMRAVGYDGRFVIRESDGELAIGVRIVSPPNDARRLDYLSYLREVFLLPLSASELPPQRLVSAAQRERARLLLASLQRNFSLPGPAAHAAPALARALERYGRCRAALGLANPLPLRRVQDDAGGSRFELGLGAELDAPALADLQVMAERLRARQLTGTIDRELEGLLDSLQPPAQLESDPLGRWIFDACGLRTVHPLASGRLYLSHFPAYGLVLDVGAVQGNQPLLLQARSEAPRDPAIDASLAGALEEARARTPAGALAFTVRSTAEAAALLERAALPGAGPLAVLEAAGLRTASNALALATQRDALRDLPAELYRLLRLDDTFERDLVAGAAAAAAPLTALVERLGSAGVCSVLPLFSSDNRFSLLAATSELPGGALGLNVARSVFRWSVLPLESDDRVGTLDSLMGSRNRYHFAGAGSASQVAALLCIGAARRGRSDARGRVEPFHIQIDLEPGSPALDLRQYEHLMNVLDRLHPLGVTVDTSQIRARHVDPAGTNQPLPLSRELRRTFRPFRVRRPLGDRFLLPED